MTEIGYTGGTVKPIELLHIEVDEKLYEADVTAKLGTLTNGRVRLPERKRVEEENINGLTIKKYYYLFEPVKNSKNLTDFIDTASTDEIKQVIKNILELLIETEEKKYKFFALAPNSIYIDETLNPEILIYYPLYYEGSNFEWEKLELPFKITSNNYTLETKNSRIIAELFSYMYMKDKYKRQERKNKQRYAIEVLLSEGKFDIAHWLNQSFKNSYDLKECYAKYKSALEKEEKRTKNEKMQGTIRYKTGSYSLFGRNKLRESDDYKETMQVNQDSYLERRIDNKNTILIAVMDGVSTASVGNGTIASQTAFEILDEMFRTYKWSNEDVDEITPTEVETFFQNFIEKANSAIVEKALQIAKEKEINIDDPSRMMSTTFTGVLVLKDRFFTCTVGDSPCYILSKEEIKRINIEHNLGRENLLTGFENTRAEELTEVLGKSKKENEQIVPDKPNYHFVYGKILQGEMITLMSDGVIDFTNGMTIEDKEVNFQRLFMQKYAETNKLKQTVIEVLKEIDNQGAGDNITLCVVEPIRQKIENQMSMYDEKTRNSQNYKQYNKNNYSEYNNRR